MVELGPHLATERARVETPHLPVRAPGIYPDAQREGLVERAERLASDTQRGHERGLARTRRPGHGRTIRGRPAGGSPSGR